MKLAVSLLLLACLTPTFAAAQDDADATARAKVLALEKAWNQAYKVGDTKAPGRDSGRQHAPGGGRWLHENQGRVSQDRESRHGQ